MKLKMNNLLAMIICFSISMTAVFTNPCFEIPMMSGAQVSDGEFDELIQSALAEVNAQRAAAGVSEIRLEVAGPLADTASVRAKEACVSWSHVRPNGQAWYTVNPDVQYGGNLAYGYSDAASVVNAWMSSPTHKNNLLYGAYTSMAIKVFVQDGVYFWAQEFCI